MQALPYEVDRPHRLWAQGIRPEVVQDKIPVNEEGEMGQYAFIGQVIEANSKYKKDSMTPNGCDKLLDCTAVIYSQALPLEV